jgi:hypothetical protein
LAKLGADRSRDRLAARQAQQLHRDLSAILLSAAGALVDQLHGVGISDPADIARRLNRRGFPCFGRSRWTTAAVRTVLRRQARKDDVGDPVAPQESACAGVRHSIISPSAST